MTAAEYRADLKRRGRCTGHPERTAVAGKVRCQECLDYGAKYRADHREKAVRYAQTYYQDNKVALDAAHDRHDRENPEAAKKRNRDYKRRRRQEIEFRIADTLRARLLRAVSAGWRGGSAVRDLGCTIPEFRSYIEALWEPGMTWANHGSGLGTWQLDHRRPLASFDLTAPVQARSACHFLNLQPLWFDDHVRKSVADRTSATAASGTWS